jgi:hypothetical protein
MPLLVLFSATIKFQETTAMRTFQRTLLAGAIALTLASPAAAQFTNAIFGDSLPTPATMVRALP